MRGLFVISSGNSTIFFDLSDKSFDQVSLLITFTIKGTTISPIATRWNYRLNSLGRELPTQFITVIALVAHHR